MHARVRVLGHGVHPILIVFPLGLLATAVVFDVLRLITDEPNFSVAAAFTIAAGVIGGLTAAVFGLADWTAIPRGTRAKRVGSLHGAANFVVVTLFAVSWLLRANADNWEPSAGALVLSFAGAALAGVSGWLGGELVERLGVGVDDDAHVDAPSSLSSATARSDRGPRP